MLATSTDAEDDTPFPSGTEDETYAFLFTISSSSWAKYCFAFSYEIGFPPSIKSDKFISKLSDFVLCHAVEPEHASTAYAYLDAFFVEQHGRLLLLASATKWREKGKARRDCRKELYTTTKPDTVGLDSLELTIKVNTSSGDLCNLLTTSGTSIASRKAGTINVECNRYVLIISKTSPGENDSETEKQKQMRSKRDLNNTSGMAEAMTSDIVSEDQGLLGSRDSAIFPFDSTHYEGFFVLLLRIKYFCGS
ncbi:L-arabinokinase [Senna tora]|uniref:L-arabinokinase n=1 Tax=Senna tora TaxID=362788 RepID=A0A834TX08_9FABA|nr:L-arabinokinase [Senna tora]